MPDKFLTAKQVAERLGYCEATITKMARAGVVPSIMIGPQSRRFDFEAVVQALAVRKPGEAKLYANK